ncbi:MAG: Asp-tRNA(Asn)/Glu-tRNA(Gln) amidotransferase subunit GatC [Candidatus Neomarinimicrobiota bacterium]|tara:strand:+ start:623 stop:934 length:312 start_codon:yes stop_codon:yes gene_type:complete
MSNKNKITEQEVKKIADLSRLSLTKDELEKRTEDMNNILNYMDILNEIDTDDVEELDNVHDMHASLRADTANSSLSKEDILKNSPSSNGDYIQVPLTVKKESQ